MKHEITCDVLKHYPFRFDRVLMYAAAWFTSHVSKASSADLKARSNQSQLDALATGYDWKPNSNLVTGPLTMDILDFLVRFDQMSPECGRTVLQLC